MLGGSRGIWCMSGKRRDRDYLGDMLEAMERIVGYMAGLTYEEFMADKRTQDAVIRNIEVMGEAAKRVSADLKRKHGGIAWKEMGGMRDKVIHHYFGINYDIVWTVAVVEIPGLVGTLRSVLERLKGAVGGER